MLWVQLKPESKLVLPSFVELIKVGDDPARTIDLSKVSDILARPQVKAQVDCIEIYYDSTATKVTGIPTGATHHEIHQ
jgi:CRISPR-associated protein Csh2